jgi:gliding motility-associated-like protein
MVNQLPFVFSNLTSGTYTLGLTDPSGCEVVIPVFVDVDNEPAIVFDPAEITIVRGESVLLSPGYLFNPNEYLWSPASGLSCTDCPAPFASPDESTIYTILATDDSGCFAEAEISIILRGNTRVYIPSAFSPNYDGINDLFYIQAADDNARVVQLQIFDRWGNALFESVDSPVNDPDFGWDGTYRGKRMNSGVFVYTALIRFPDGFERLYKGEATIVY